MKKQILLKPIISEKSEKISEDLGQYSFVVNRKANKVEIRQAVESEFNVSVKSVNTMIIPGKRKTRNTKSGIIRGGVSAVKKAIITLEEGETIDYFGDI
jgi:large subunit ribosomal protein L23